MSTLTDNEIARFAASARACDFMGAAATMQRLAIEVRQLRAAVAPDKERVRAVVATEVRNGFGRRGHGMNVGFDEDVATRVAEQLATAAPVEAPAQPRPSVRELSFEPFRALRPNPDDPGAQLRLERSPDGLVELADERVMPDRLRARATLILVRGEAAWLHATLGKLLATQEGT
jgi:hypothetical protein